MISQLDFGHEGWVWLHTCLGTRAQKLELRWHLLCLCSQDGEKKDGGVACHSTHLSMAPGEGDGIPRLCHTWYREAQTCAFPLAHLFSSWCIKRTSVSPIGVCLDVESVGNSNTAGGWRRAPGPAPAAPAGPSISSARPSLPREWEEATVVLRFSLTSVFSQN